MLIVCDYFNSFCFVLNLCLCLVNVYNTFCQMTKISRQDLGNAKFVGIFCIFKTNLLDVLEFHKEKRGLCKGKYDAKGIPTDLSLYLPDRTLSTDTFGMKIFVSRRYFEFDVFEMVFLENNFGRSHGCAEFDLYQFIVFCILQMQQTLLTDSRFRFIRIKIKQCDAFFLCSRSFCTQIWCYCEG